MSHIGKKIINIPLGLEVHYQNNILKVSGPLGIRKLQIPKFLAIQWLGNPINQMSLSLQNENIVKRLKQQKSLWGTYRTLIQHVFQGVKTGFSIKLVLVGVGYRAQIDKKILFLKLGYSHSIQYEIPENITIQCIQPTILLITGQDKQKVHQVAANIRSYRKPEPYKGKGIRYENEKIRIKEGKRT